MGWKPFGAMPNGFPSIHPLTKPLSENFVWDFGLKKRLRVFGSLNSIFFAVACNLSIPFDRVFR